MRILVVAKKSTFSQMGADPRTQHMLKSPELAKARAVHKRHQKTVDTVRSFLTRKGVLTHFVDGLHESIPEEGYNLVVTIGGDGTLLSASHHVGRNVPILGINSDPKTSVGFFCSVDGSDHPVATLTKILNGETMMSHEVTRMRVKLDDQVLSTRVLNDVLFSHACPAATSKFSLKPFGAGNPRTSFSCSGIWIATGAGSTAAIKCAGGEVKDMDDQKLQAVVREPYFRKTHSGTPATWYHVRNLKIVSKMADAMIHMDGPFHQWPVTYGQTLTCDVSPEPLCLIK